MTQEQYIEQNSLGFEGDSILGESIRKICEDNKISWIIETGTYRGATTKKFAMFAKKVDSIEADPLNHKVAEAVLNSIENVKLHLGSSEEVLDGILASIPNKGRKPNIFFFLDAHWGDHNPLLEELELIAKYKLKPVIAIHDFKVPEHPELGYDVYGSFVYEFDTIKPSFDKIYGEDGYEYWYNSEAIGAKRGCIFIKKK